jgi:hypothetical protein
MQEHPLTGLTAFGIVMLLLGGLLLSPAPVLSVSTQEPTRITLETPAPPKQLQPQPPVDDIAPPQTGTREPPKTEPDGITRRLAESLGLKAEDLTLVTAFQVTWANSCLGCQQPGTQCLQVLTPGEQRLYRAADGREYDVRVGRNDYFLICSGTDKAAPAPTPTPRAAILPLPTPGFSDTDEDKAEPGLNPPAPALEAARLPYQLTLTNAGATARTAVVTADLPAGVTVAAVASPAEVQVFSEAEHLELRVLELEPGASALVRITFESAAAAMLAEIAPVTTWETSNADVAVALAPDTGFVIPEEPPASPVTSWALAGMGIAIAFSLGVLALAVARRKHA